MADAQPIPELEPVDRPAPAQGPNMGDLADGGS